MIDPITVNGLPAELILILPDWSDPVSLELGVPVDIDRGKSGKEIRRPEGLHPRFKMTFTPDWLKDDSADISTMRAGLAKKRVAVPIFPDTQSSIADEFMFVGQHYISWNDAGTLYAIDADTYTNAAPLAFGYIENNEFVAKTDEIGRTSLIFIEDCPYSHRIKLSVAPTTKSFTLDPDWKSDPIQRLVSPLKRTDIGKGREKQIEEEEDVFSYEMSANFLLMDQSELKYLLSFWYQMKGRLYPFTVPAFFQPATGAPATPDAYFARFRGEALRIQFRAPLVGSSTLGFIQLPWELNDSGVEYVTDKSFEDATQWDGFGLSEIDTATGISGMPDQVARIAPNIGSDRQLETLSLDAAVGDLVRASVLMSEDGSLSNTMKLIIVAFNSGHSVLGSVTTSLASPTTTPEIVEAEYTLPASTDHFEVNLQVTTDGTTGGFGYFGDMSVVLFKSGAEVLEETPNQTPNTYAFDFSYQIPGKANERLIDWERDTDIGGNTFTAYKMTMGALSKGSRLFNEQATIEYAHEADNPLLQYVEGEMERLVTLTVSEGNPMRPETFKTVFIGTLKRISLKGRKVKAAFTAFGGLFDVKLPGFLIQDQCNYLLGDANCKISLASLEASGSSTSANLSNGDMEIEVPAMTGTLTTANDPNVVAGDRFAGGYLFFGSDANYQIRYIKKTTIGAGNDRTFTVNRPIDGTKLDASDGVIHVFPGCGGTEWECTDQWSNFVNFGGHLYVPEKLDTVRGASPKVGK